MKPTELASQVGELSDLICQQRDVEVNLGKTMIMDIGVRQPPEAWKIVDGKGEVVMEIQGTKEYVYLGVTIDGRKVHGRHMTKTLQQIPPKIGAMKATARDTPNRVWAADAMWTSMVRPQVLHAAEAITYTETWIKTVETQQNKVGRWILGVSDRAPSVAVRAELGWHTMRGLINKKKVLYWGRLEDMDNSRWTKKIYKHATECGREWTWGNQLTKAKGDLRITQYQGPYKEWKGDVKSQHERREAEIRDEGIRTHDRLNDYPGPTGGTARIYRRVKRSRNIMQISN